MKKYLFLIIVVFLIFPTLVNAEIINAKDITGSNAWIARNADSGRMTAIEQSLSNIRTNEFYNTLIGSIYIPAVAALAGSKGCNLQDSAEIKIYTVKGGNTQLILTRNLAALGTLPKTINFVYAENPLLTTKNATSTAWIGGDSTAAYQYWLPLNDTLNTRLMLDNIYYTLFLFDTCGTGDTISASITHWYRLLNVRN